MSLDWNACSTFHSRSSSDLAPCAGAGTPNDPFIVDWDLFDPGNPYNWSKVRKWLITMQVGLYVSLFIRLAQTRSRLPFVHGL